MTEQPLFYFADPMQGKAQLGHHILKLNPDHPYFHHLTVAWADYTDLMEKYNDNLITANSKLHEFAAIANEYREQAMDDSESAPYTRMKLAWSNLRGEIFKPWEDDDIETLLEDNDIIRDHDNIQHTYKAIRTICKDWENQLDDFFEEAEELDDYAEPYDEYLIPEFDINKEYHTHIPTDRVKGIREVTQHLTELRDLLSNNPELRSLILNATKYFEEGKK